MGRRNDFILLMAEKNCYPDKHLESKYPAIQSPWRFVNAGSLMGNAGAIRAALDPWVHDFNSETDDQRFWTRLFLDEAAAGRDTIHIDSDCRVFQSVFMMQIPGDLFMTENGWLNNITQTHPAVFHANGDHDTVWRVIYPGVQLHAVLTGDDLVDRFMHYRFQRQNCSSGDDLASVRLLMSPVYALCGLCLGVVLFALGQRCRTAALPD